MNHNVNTNKSSFTRILFGMPDYGKSYSFGKRILMGALRGTPASVWKPSNNQRLLLRLCALLLATYLIMNSDIDIININYNIIFLFNTKKINLSYVYSYFFLNYFKRVPF